MPPPGAGQPAAAPTSGRAVAALVVGILGICAWWFWFVFGVTAIMLGVAARREIRRSGGAIGGDGLAMAGIVLGVVAIVFTVAWALTMFALGWW